MKTAVRVTMGLFAGAVRRVTQRIAERVVVKPRPVRGVESKEPEQ